LYIIGLIALLTTFSSLNCKKLQFESTLGGLIMKVQYLSPRYFAKNDPINRPIGAFFIFAII